MYKDLDEQALARYCSQRDRLAVDELYRRYAARVYSLCRRYLGNDDDAKDLMMETLLQAIDKMESFHYTGEGSLYGWIGRIAINKALNQIKRHRWRKVPLDMWARDDIPEPTEEETVSIPKEKLQVWISELPDLRRAVFNLYCIDGYSHKEIARMLGISETGSTSILVKARKQLKDKIKQYLKEQEI
ncbi:MAG: sigma-70 family RNA polymerase sigma factor [Bacteroidales bacterium]|nr:sigma-70 family RNA polymerase sigma factor [Bacteroidales bacterium]